ncbi:head-tail adaptor protein [Azospirillum sp.]|uniref:head-tail adaptor protein n=1 Tax=Azospirillum sp. TaxID=34012 RepID=UPI002D6C937B|nr:head-tail adaptor protein [Azospirillum sp.]HYD66172.1 head-tail adaptor protein [Azospirillum sp.]
MPRARQLRERVAFEKRSVVSDGFGNVRGEFEQQFVCAAAIVAKFGGEAVTAARLSGQQPVVITVRQVGATAEITTDWRARDVRTGVIYNIRSIADPDAGGQWLEMLCQSGVAT